MTDSALTVEGITAGYGGGDVLHQPEIGAARDGVGMAPARDVMARRLHEDAEPHLATLHRLLIHLCVLNLRDL